MSNLTITLPEEVASWLQAKATAENPTVSDLVQRMLEREMRQTEMYLDAWHRWKQIPPGDIEAQDRLAREEAHARR